MNTNTSATHLRASVSTWALHNTLGTTYWDTPEKPVKQAAETYGPGSMTLLEVPARLAAMGVQTMELCHFHLPTRDKTYLHLLRNELDAAGVELWSLLIDAGDLSHPEHTARDLAWIGEWVDTAGALGAKRTRVIAGKAEYSDAALERSVAGFRALAARAQAQNVRLMTENWFALLSRPEPLLTLLDRLEGTVGLCADFGNWGGPTKYDDLAAIFPRAESCHAKSEFNAPGIVETTDFNRCLDLTRAAGFHGPYTLVHAGPGDEWEGLASAREALLPYLTD